jgi:hypothetical protein
MMFAQHAGVRVITQSAQQRRGTFNVGEEEGQRLDYGILRDLFETRRFVHVICETSREVVRRHETSLKDREKPNDRRTASVARAVASEDDEVVRRGNARGERSLGRI